METLFGWLFSGAWQWILGKLGMSTDQKLGRLQVLKVHMDIPPDLLGVYVPSLALQPLVENAIKHGFSVDSTASRLEIAAKLHNGRVWLCVRDDGPGPAPGSRLRLGVGLTNVRSRLKQLYGDESSLELTGGDGRGCEAIITLPLRSSH